MYLAVAMVRIHTFHAVGVLQTQGSIVENKVVTFDMFASLR